MNEALAEITKRSKSYADADFLPTIFGKFHEEAVARGAPVVLFGAGSAGRELYPILKLHGVNPVCFCDNNPSRVGELCCGLPIISVPQLRREQKESLIVVTTGAYRDEVKQQLIDLGFSEDKVLTISNQEAMCYYTHLSQWYWTQDDLITHEDELLDVYNLLSDQRSKDIFTSRIALFVHGADYLSFRNFISSFSDVPCAQGSNFQECMNSTNYNAEAYLQFNNDIIHLNDNEVFIDAGAFTGDSTLEFIKACSSNNLTYRRILCFEPDRKIFEELKENTARFERISLKPLGLWSHSTTIRFAGSDIQRPGSTRIISENENTTIDVSGITEISTISIDETFHDDLITLIKMDVEGAEIAALRGATNTIKKCRPKLIISAYHKRNDLFEIPLLINGMVPDYKFYYRHFSNNFGETTLFAIP
jgi:FkbM family methyltransferase